MTLQKTLTDIEVLEASSKPYANKTSCSWWDPALQCMGVGGAIVKAPLLVGSELLQWEKLGLHDSVGVWRTLLEGFLQAALERAGTEWMVRQWVGPEASVLGKDLLDDVCAGFEEHKNRKPGEALRIRDIANLTECVQEASSPTSKSEGDFLPSSEIQGCLNVRKSLLVSITQWEGGFKGRGRG